jgi:ATP-dependent Clp protease ATP-binding subunit ClpA
MLCLNCKKNEATVFAEVFENNVKSVKGYCEKCASELGIKAATVSENGDVPNFGIDNLTKQIESMMEQINKQMNDPESESVDEYGNPKPFGGMFHSIFKIDSNNGKITNISELAGEESNSSGVGTKTKVKQNKEKKQTPLDYYGTNLTDVAKTGKIDEVIGRNAEIERIIQVLNRRYKNNPCLIGEPRSWKNGNCTGLSNKNCKK